MPLHAFRDLMPDGERGIERGHRLLEDHRHPVAADIGEFAFGEGEEIAAVEDRLSRDNIGRRAGQQTHQRQRRHAFAAPRFPDDAQRFARIHGERDVLDEIRNMRGAREFQRETTDFEYGMPGGRIGLILAIRLVQRQLA